MLDHPFHPLLGYEEELIVLEILLKMPIARIKME
jgi:hypothetical protein